MPPDPDYPRWMFHRSLDPVIVQSAEEEAALGTEWRRTIAPLPPPEEKDGRRSIDKGRLRNVQR